MIFSRVLPAVALIAALGGAEEPPWLHRLEPFGAARGETIELNIVGERLPASPQILFDSAGLEWVETLAAGSESIRGRLRVAAGAAPGPRLITARGANGRSNARLFWIDPLPSTREAEPNDRRFQAQLLELRPQVLHGALLELADVDVYRFAARSGERWTFDLRSIEYGGFLESELTLLNSAGVEIAFNDDRDDYLETPLIEHVFAEGGDYFLRVDQYRGPQRVNCAKNCGYMLRMYQGPRVTAMSRLGARRGSDVELAVFGSSLARVESAYLASLSNGEYYRLTFPHTIPVTPSARWRSGSTEPIEARILERGDGELRLRFAIPTDASTGLWRPWLVGPEGPVDGLSFEVSGLAESSESEVLTLLEDGPRIVNGGLSVDGEEDSFAIAAEAGRMFHVSILAVQMGLPRFDPLLELFDAQGRLVAEHDDLMTGQGTVIGNPDPSLYYLPESSEPLRLVVRDRIGRGGPDFVYRLRADYASPGFTLVVDPENPAVARGGASQIGVLLIRDPGFDQSVKVWAEGAAQGIAIAETAFRADQFFGPSADGDNVIIPTAELPVRADDDAELGDRLLRIFGQSPDGQRVEAFATMWIGPPRNRNDVRRPLPEVRLTVVEADASALRESSLPAAR